MKMTPINSSMISAAGYDPEARELIVEFANGTRYSYDEVPPDLFDHFLGADSPGRFFHQRIKGVYPGKKI